MDNLSSPIQRILLQTVGTGRDPQPAKNDPGNPVWDALAFAVKQVQPHILVQLCSHKTREETIPKFDESLGVCTAEREFHVAEDADDVIKLALEYGEVWRILRKAHPRAEFHADFTSGTKPMSAALLATAIAHGIHHVHYATGPRDAGGRVTQTTDLQQLHAGDLIAEQQLNELGRLFNHGEFGAVRAQANQLLFTLSNPNLRSRAESLSGLSNAYELWDRFEWSGALKVLSGLLKDEQASHSLSQAGWNDAQLNEQKQHLRRCEPNRPTYERQADLLANVDRRLRACQFDDALSRLYRLTELLLQQRFVTKIHPERIKSNNPTKSVPVNLLNQVAPRSTETMIQRKAQGATEWNLGLSDTMEVLAEAGDPLGIKIWHDYTGGTGKHDPKTNGPLYQQLEKRNNSWLAHGSKPIDEETAQGLRASIEKYLSEHFEGQDQPGPMPLAEYMRTIRFAKCPWV